MGTVLAIKIIKKAQSILNDEDGVRWGDAEMLSWLNDAQREFVLMKPNAYTRSESIKLVSGTKQTLPSDGVQLFDVVRNMGARGDTPGRSVRIVLREVLDAQLPDWHSETPSASVKHYLYSVLDPKRFYVFPPQPSANQGFVEIVYGAVPPEIEDAGSAISLDDIYSNALIDYLLYRAYSKDSEFSADANRAAIHQSAYTSAIAGKAQIESGTNPNVSAPANTSTPTR